MATKDITDTQVVKAATVHWAIYKAGVKNGPSTAAILSGMTGQPEKVCWRAVERAIRHGYLEHGVSLRSSWVTEKGKALVDAAINDVAMNAFAEAYIAGQIARLDELGKVISN